MMLFIRRSVSFSFCWLACVIRMQVVGEEERDAQNTNTGDCTTRQPNSRRSEEFKIAVYDGTAFWRCCCDEKSFLPFILRLSLSLSRFLLLPFPFLDCEGSRASNTEAVQLVAFRWSWILLTLLRRLRGGGRERGRCGIPIFRTIRTPHRPQVGWMVRWMGKVSRLHNFPPAKVLLCAAPTPWVDTDSIVCLHTRSSRT